MGRFRLVLVLAVLTLMPLPSAAGPADDASVVVERWVTAFNSNDVDALVSLYAPNAILVRIDRPSPQGRARGHPRLFRPVGKKWGQGRFRRPQDHRARRQRRLCDRVL